MNPITSISARLVASLIAGTGGLAEAQLLSSGELGGSVLGGVIGGIVGHNSGGRTAEGIGIGMGAGWLAGRFSRDRPHYDTYIPSRSQSRHADTPTPARRPHHAITGAAVGAVAGGVIGHNSGSRTLEGVGIGAASGLLLGGAVEAIQNRQANRHYFAEEAPPQQSPVFHSNPPAARPTAFPQTITSRDIRDGAVITSTTPALETGSTLIRQIPDSKPSVPVPTKKPAIRFEFLGTERRQ